MYKPLKNLKKKRKNSKNKNAKKPNSNTPVIRSNKINKITKKIYAKIMANNKISIKSLVKVAIKNKLCKNIFRNSKFKKL